MSNTLDDLFQWAAQQPSNNITTVQIALVTNDLRQNNLVSYTEGTLYFHPARSGGTFLLPAYFASQDDRLTQYFSDRRYAGQPGDFNACPFACDQTDPLQITVNLPFLPTGGNYSVTLKLLKWGFQISFEPSYDASTGVLYGVIYTAFITISLCGRESMMQ